MSKNQYVTTNLNGIKLKLNKESDIELLHLFNNSYISLDNQEKKRDRIRTNKAKEKLTNENKEMYKNNLEKAKNENNTESWFVLWKKR